MRRRQPVSPGLRAWLRAPNSLSARLAQACGAFSVRVLDQGGGAARPHERRALGLPLGHALHQRSVWLLGAGAPQVMARSVCAQTASRGAWRALRGLGARPLAELLFGRRDIRRSPLQAVWWPPRHPEARALHRAWQRQTGQPCPARGVWERHSVFRRRGQALMVRECFLPARVAGWPRPQGRGRYSRSE